jgi:oxygen-independent coproporphyrinogen III oxidase
LSYKNNHSNIAIYIHIPYCISKCPYCDFNSYAISKDKPTNRTAELEEERYTRALLSELTFYVKDSPYKENLKNRFCHSIFFGGGTPSLFSANSIGTIIAEIKNNFQTNKNLEVTLEANPGTISEQLDLNKLIAFRAAGVNRISMGVQSFNQEKLNFLGRWHNKDCIYSSITNIKDSGFKNFNLDLIFGTKQDTPEIWKNDLLEALSFSPTHISVYGLTIEPGTEFDKLFKKNRLKTQTDETQAQQYTLTQDILLSSGYEQYEISNFSKPGFNCLHNTSYWIWLDYLSLGAGAHSFLKNQAAISTNLEQASRWSNIPKPSHYIERALQGGNCAQRIETIDKKQAEIEYIMCRIRTSLGINHKEFERLFDLSFPDKYRDEIKELLKENLLHSTTEQTNLTKKGFLFGDFVLGALAK